MSDLLAVPELAESLIYKNFIYPHCQRHRAIYFPLPKNISWDCTLNFNLYQILQVTGLGVWDQLWVGSSPPPPFMTYCSCLLHARQRANCKMRPKGELKVVSLLPINFYLLLFKFLPGIGSLILTRNFLNKKSKFC